MVGVDSEVRYSCPLLSKIVHNGDRVERAQSSLPRSRERLRMEAECPHSHQLLQAREHQGIHDEALLSQLFITQVVLSRIVKFNQISTEYIHHPDKRGRDDLTRLGS